jgi:hypothetical protein
VLDLSEYRVAADRPTIHPVVVLVCDVCAQHAGQGDVRWWDDGYSPSIPELAAEAEKHERRGHTT